MREGRPGGQVLKCLDLYCGAGGLAFLEDGSNETVTIQSKWAVDYDPSACFSFQANYPDAQVLPPAFPSSAGHRHIVRDQHTQIQQSQVVSHGALAPYNPPRTYVRPWSVLVMHSHA